MWVLLLNMLTVMHIRWVSLKGLVGRSAGRFTVRPQFPPVANVFFLVSKRTLYFFWEVVVWMLHIGRARHPGPGGLSFLVNCLSNSPILVGG